MMQKIKHSKTLKLTGRSDFEKREWGRKCKILEMGTKMVRIKIIRIFLEHNCPFNLPF